MNLNFLLTSFINYLRKVIKFNKGLAGLSIKQHWEIYNEWKSQLESKKYPIDFELPWITIVAKNYIENYLSKKSKTDMKVFEYGSGGSSLFFLKFAKEVISVEHDKEWFERVNECVNKKNSGGWEGNLLEAEIINTDSAQLDVSNPHHYHSSDSNFINHTFKKYASYISKFPDNYFDIVLVDGRSRPSCLFHSVMKVKKGGLLVLDNADRKYYLAHKTVNPRDFILVNSSYGAAVCLNQFTQTNIYIKK